MPDDDSKPTAAMKRKIKKRAQVTAKLNALRKAKQATTNARPTMPMAKAVPAPKTIPTAKVAPASVPEKGSTSPVPVPILLHIRLSVKKGPPPLALMVNNLKVDLKKPYVKITSDRKFVVQVFRKGLKPLVKPIVLDSRKGKLLPNYDLDINLY